jgi:hypothetical protein
MPEQAEILSHIPNSGIVQLPGRRFPGVVIQGDTLSNLFDGARYLLAQFRELRDEECYYEILMLAEQLQAQLQHYEQTLAQSGTQLPYSISISQRLVTDDFDVPPTNA